MARRGRPPHPGILTPREWEVLDLLRQSLSNKEIADRLGITERGAKYHVSEILSKLGVSSRQEAAAIAEPRARGRLRELVPLGLFGKLTGATVVAAALAGIAVLAWAALANGGGSDSASEDVAALPSGAAATPGAPAPGKIAFTSDRDGNPEIYVMDADGSNVARLTDDPAIDTAPSWSPDGRRIAFMSTRSSSSEVYVMDANGSNVALVGGGAFPAWSPDGAHIAFSWSGEIFLMSATGSGRTQLTVTLMGASSSSAAWSPDGTSIVFESSRLSYGERRNLYVIDVDGSVETNLTDSPDYDSDPDWSPDGTRIAFVRGTTGLSVMDADGANVRLLAENASWPSWSPDGTQIAFYSGPSGNAGIYVMNADGSGQTRLSRDLADDYFPAWSPATTNH